MPAGPPNAFAASSRDPVCGMQVGTGESLSASVGGRTFYFCGTDCLDEFTANPRRFLEDDSGRGTPDRSGCCR